MTERLARHAALHPKRMLAIWGAIFVLSIAAIALLLPSAITTDATVTNDPESEQGYEAMFTRLPRSDDFVNEVVLFRAPGKDVTSSPEVRGEVERLAAALEATGRRTGSRPTTARTTRAWSRRTRTRRCSRSGWAPTPRTGSRT